MVRKLQTSGDAFLRPFLINPSSGAPQAHLDGIRASAILLVVVFHVWALSGAPALLAALPPIGAQLNLTSLAASGFIGVQLFFVLSGFLLAQYWLKPSFQGKPRPSTRQYFKQRLFRIVPAYYCCLFLVLLFFVPAFIPARLVHSKMGLFTLGANLLFLQYLFPVSGTSYIIEGAFWTLTIEMLFYLSLPLVIWCFLKQRWVYSLAVAIVISVAWRYLTRHSLDPLVHFVQYHTPGVILAEGDARYFLSQQLLGHAANFALGISLANIYVQFQLKCRKDRLFQIFTHDVAGFAYFISGIALQLFVVYNFFQNPDLAWAYYSHGLLDTLGFTLLLAGGCPWIRGAFSTLPLRFIGTVSYSIYLWHLPLIHLFNSYLTIAASPPQTIFFQVLCATLVAVLILATGSYLAIEKLFMQLGYKRQPTKKTGIDAPQDALPTLPTSGTKKYWSVYR